MGCNCDKKGYANKNNAFTKAVVEINNPEQIVLFRKVVIPASMGDDTDVPPAVGKYRNVILRYEANKHTYLYSSDGIPTLLELEVPQEVWDKIDALEAVDTILQREIDNLKNAPDVVDIVATYADLQAYDTSSLTDKDIIRVLADETHNEESAYYRWNKSTETWSFIGTINIRVFTTTEWNALWA